MKDLTHYFNSPHDKETAVKTIAVETSSECHDNMKELLTSKEPVTKKRKISLSKSKKKKDNCEVNANENKVNSGVNNKNESETKNEDLTPEKAKITKNKKRKLSEESNSNSKKVKIKSLKVDVKNRDTSSNRKNTTSTEKGEDKNFKSMNGFKDLKTEEVLNIESNDSCEELFVRKKRKKPSKNLFVESDDELCLEERISQSLPENQTPLIDKFQNSEKSPNSSRNSLFSYFNKVDKETALQKKSEKIKVEALIHLPPSGDNKISRHSLDKLPFVKKSKKYKNNAHLDNSDTIEVVSSEEIVDENSPPDINLQTSNDTEPREEVVKKIGNTSKPKPKELVHFFIPQKMEKQNVKTESNSSKNIANKNTPGVEETEKIIIEKDSKKELNSHNKKSNNNIKKNSNVKTSVSNKSSSKQLVQMENSKSKCEEDLENNKKLKTKRVPSNTNGFVKSKKITHKLSDNSCCTSENQKNTEELNLLENSKTPTKNHVTPQKEILQKEQNPHSKTHKTPNQKCSTLNSYFTPKSNNISSGKEDSKTKHKSKRTPSPWVMKVRLSSTTGSLSDSESDSKDSLQKVKKETVSSQEKFGEKIDIIPVNKDSDTVSPVVVIDDDSNGPSEDCEKYSARRILLPRSAKKLKLIPAKDETNDESPKPKPPVKMWPFFQKGAKQRPKEPAVDEAKLKAKMLFLESGVPEVIKRRVDIIKNEVIIGLPAPFPTVCHVTQTDVSVDGGCNIEKFPLPARCCSPPPICVPSWSSVLSSVNSEEPDIPVFQRPTNIKAFLQQLKEEDPNTEVKVLYKKLKEYKSKAETDVWTDIYKPTKAADMVGNSASIKKLKSWLESLKNRRRREGSVSSGDEFVNDDSEEDDNTFNNMAIISGPIGCGKTSAVYAIANELDCKVLEINSSCNRSGKRILAEFSESTQSHQVERSQSLNGYFNNQKGRKMKKKKKSSVTNNESKSEKTSLILVEDADVLFANIDEGFMQALSSLAATSKRPIILVTNQYKNSHLDRFNSTRLVQFMFSRPKPSKLGMWLRLVGLVEGVIVTADQANKLVEWSNCDVRRCLLQLQLMVHSNNSEIKERLTEVQLWWRWPGKYQLQYELPTMLEPENMEAQSENNKSVIIKQLQSIAKTTSHLAYLDVLSAHSRLRMNGCEDEDPCPMPWRATCRDSTSLAECQEGHHNNQGAKATSANMATWLADVVARDLQSNSLRWGQTADEARWLSVLRQGEKFFMPGIATMMHNNHESVACDYMPTLRNIGRAEQIRLANYTRRANRFFNYLQGLGIHAGKSYCDFMCDVFS